MRWTLVVVAILLLPFVLLYAYIAYKQHPVRSFCSGLHESATPEEVVALAERRFGPVPHDSDEVLVVDVGPPVFRFACDVRFKNGKIVSKDIVDGD
jgi:hypothetical protein